MRRPQISDDGTTVELDVHGAGVDNAMTLIHNAIRLSASRGRNTLRVIHGSSTTDADGQNRTIKRALAAVLGEGIDDVASYHPMQDVTLISLVGNLRRDPSSVTLLDLR